MALAQQQQTAAPTVAPAAPAQAPANDFGSNSAAAAGVASTQGNGAAPAAGTTEAPAWAAAVAPTTLLKRGSKGPAVTDLQTKLKAAGMNVGAIDGDFGPTTEAAVRAFQKRSGLEIDGVAGPATMGALSRSAAPNPATPAPAAPAAGTPAAPAAGGTLSGTPPLEQGAKGEQVTLLQNLLVSNGIPCGVDGNFGAGTEAAVRSFQTSRALGSDGVVGPNTAAALNSRAPAVVRPPAQGQGQTPGAPVAPAEGAGAYDPRGYLNSSSIAPATRRAAQATAVRLQGEGYQPYIVAGFRSTGEQNDLYAQGRTTAGQVVTGVRGGGSWHNYGAAVDIAFWNDRHTGPSWEEKHPWSRIGPAGLASGFTRWGGDFGDRPHLELHPQWGNSCYNLASTLANEGLSSVWSKIGAS